MASEKLAEENQRIVDGAEYWAEKYDLLKDEHEALRDAYALLCVKSKHLNGTSDYEKLREELEHTQSRLEGAQEDAEIWYKNWKNCIETYGVVEKGLANLSGGEKSE